jgi:hypothetical protein
VNARLLITAAAAVALAAPGVATAKIVPIKRHVTPRVLCICVTTGPIVLPVVSEAAVEAQIDADLIAHGLDPIYGPTPADAALEAQYDALLTASGLTPLFGAPAGP